jgi:hypothetical protein
MRDDHRPDKFNDMLSLVATARAAGQLGDPLEARVSFVSKVTDGAIEVPPGVHLPDGTPVRVEPLREESLAKRLKDVIGSVEGLPADFAEHHDHYIHGTPKK